MEPSCILRYLAGVMPKQLSNARVNASCEPYRKATAISNMEELDINFNSGDIS